MAEEYFHSNDKTILYSVPCDDYYIFIIKNKQKLFGKKKSNIKSWQIEIFLIHGLKFSL